MTNFTASGHQLVTRQRNGKDGRSVSKVDVVYQRSTSATSVPTSWVTTAPKLPKGYYLWSATKVTYKEADGKTTTEVIGAQCIASADNLKTTVERYAQTTSRTTPPDNSSSAWQEGDTSGVQAKDGYYTWTQTKIVWQDGTITYTTPICITGDKGNTGKDGSDGAAGNGSRIRYALSKYPTSTNNHTPPADLTSPKYWTSDGYIGIYSKDSASDENITYNGTKYDDGWLMWQLAMPTPTNDEPYVWALSYVLKESTSEYLVPIPDNNTFTYARVNGTDGKDGKDGTDGADGNGIASRKAYFAVTDKPNLKSHSDIAATAWSADFPELSEVSDQKPYVWKSVLTTYTQLSGEYWSTPELVTTYHSGNNVNLLENAAFVSDDRMSAWSEKNGTIMTGGKDGRNFFRGLFNKRGSEQAYKEILQQTLWSSSGKKKIKPKTWYTLSYWSRQGAQDMEIATTSNAYGFATQDLYLYAGHTYTLHVNGRMNKTSNTGSRVLRVQIFNGSDSWHVDIDSSTDTDGSVIFTPTTEGHYYLQAYLYPYDSDRSSVDYGTVTLNTCRVEDNTLVGFSFLYPSAVDTAQGYFIDGVQYTDGNTDLNVQLSPNGSWDWQRHVVTFKTKSKHSILHDFEDTEYVLFRMMPSPMTGQNDYLDICMPKLEEGMFATGFTDSAEDAKGISGCILRTTEWATGITFHNDEGLNSGTRFLDIAVVTESATSFKAYKCLKTHVSSSSNAPQAGVTTECWQPINNMAPIYTPFIMAQNALLRLAQTNQIVVTDSNDNVTGGMQGDTTLPIIWAGSTTASNGTFRVMADGTMYASKGVFSGTLDGVSGTFESLADKSNKCKIGFQDNGFFFTGYTRFYDSIDVDGDIYQQGDGIFYTSKVYCRGVLGSRNRTIAVIEGRQITVYPNGYEQQSNKKTGTLTSATKDGKIVYNIELYSPLTGHGISGMPIDIVIFAPNFSSAELYYQLTGAVGKKVTLLSSKDKAGKIYVAFADGWNLIRQGGIVEAVYIGDLMTPASTKISGIGNGWMHGQMIDNTWV